MRRTGWLSDITFDNQIITYIQSDSTHRGIDYAVADATLTMRSFSDAFNYVANPDIDRATLIATSI
jgi:hypothetical protein